MWRWPGRPWGQAVVRRAVSQGREGVPDGRGEGRRCRAKGEEMRGEGTGGGGRGAVQAVNRFLALPGAGDSRRRCSLAHPLACSPGPRKDSCIALGPKSSLPYRPHPERGLLHRHREAGTT